MKKIICKHCGKSIRRTSGSITGWYHVGYGVGCPIFTNAEPKEIVRVHMHRQRYSWAKWIAILADKCPWPQDSMAFDAWCDLEEWAEYFWKGYSPNVAIGLRFGFLKEKDYENVQASRTSKRVPREVRVSRKRKANCSRRRNKITSR